MIGYEQIFIVASSGHKGCLTIVPFIYPDEDISTPEVQLGEDLSSAKLFQGCKGKRKRVTELYCYLVEYLCDLCKAAGLHPFWQQRKS